MNIFEGPLGPVNIAQLSRRTGIPASTLYRWRKDPDKMPVGDMRILLKVMCVSDDQLLRIVRGEK